MSRRAKVGFVRYPLAALVMAFLLAGFSLPASTPAPRQPPKLPALVSTEPLYGIFVFGTNSARPVWAVFDKSDRDSTAMDMLYLDLNADGDLTQGGERFTAKGEKSKGDTAVFELGTIREPGNWREHSNFKVTWRPTRVSASLKWLGDKPMNAGYGPETSKYGNFSKSPQTAPVYVFGHELPFQFQPWMCTTLQRGGPTDFKVFVGNRGEGQGSFCAVDDKFLPKQDYVIATLIYKDESGKERQEKFDLKSRC